MSAPMTQGDAANAVVALRRLLEQHPDPSGSAQGFVDRVSAHLCEQIRRLDAGIGDGGPAFPVSEEALLRNLQGMTLRDHFATQAMNGLISCLTDPMCMTAAFRNAEDAGLTPKQQIAVAAYEYADAMLKARTA